MTAKIIKCWKVSLQRKAGNSVVLPGVEVPLFTGYSKNPVNLSELKDEKFITLHTEPCLLETTSLRVDEISGATCSPIYEDDQTFKEAAKPLMKWLAENQHPHHRAIVTSCDAELLEISMVANTDEFLKD